MDKNAYETIKECEDNGTHLIDCDSDGYCNCCGYQESLPKFYQAKLEPICGDIIAHVYPKQVGKISLNDRLENNGECSNCGGNEWWLLPKEACYIRGGKPYIECLDCGFTTHL